jgi:PAS domain S-box-containing protein
MTLIATLWLLCAGIAIALAALELLVASRLRTWRVHVPFVVMAVVAAAAAVTELASYNATAVPELGAWLKATVGFQILWWMACVRFFSDYADIKRRWIPATLIGLLVLSGVIHLVSPAGITHGAAEGLTEVPLPWGESIALLAGPTHPFGFVAVLTVGALLVGAVALVGLLVRNRERRKATRVGVAVFLLVAANVHGFFVDTLVFRSPYLVVPAFLGVLVVVASDLVDAVVRASHLSREVVANQKRWASLVESVDLAVLGVDTNGRVNLVNPMLERLIGRQADQVVGQHVSTLASPDGASVMDTVVGEVARGGVPPQTEWAVRTSDGVDRTFHWSTLRLLDSGGGLQGLLAVGADLTEEQRSRRELSEALAEVTKLRDQLERENLYLQEELRADQKFDELIGESDALRYVAQKVSQVAESDVPVLLEGETGVGKELVARLIHDRSTRGQRAFIRVNCSAIPHGLVESELFGHERGAFTGAVKRRRGRFELADGGTLLLDEIGELPLEIQPKLLRALQDGEIVSVGSEEPVRVDVRIIASTNRVLTDEVRDGRFREDLYYRLAVFPITIPPLRDRQEDVPQLVSHFAATYAARQGKRIDQIPPGVMDALVRYAWPGNVRELQNVIERAVLTSQGPELRLAEPLSGAETPGIVAIGRNGPETLEAVERLHILEVLERTQWQVAGAGGAAERLGLKPSTLRSRMKKLAIERTSSR